MVMQKTHKRKKASRMHGRHQGTHGWGARKKHKKSGHRGGSGMAGTGKRGDQKKTLVNKLYGNDYFGKQGITSKKTEHDKRKRINLKVIGDNLEKFGKKTSKGWEINLKDFKILGDGEIKDKLIITALEASKSAIEKVVKAGGEIILSEIKRMETPLVENGKKKKEILPKVQEIKKTEKKIKVEKKSSDSETDESE